MTSRFSAAHLEAWRTHGGVLIERFFTAPEVQAVHDDFVTVFGTDRGRHAPLERDGKFDSDQFSAFEAIPFDCSPALNLIGVHPELMRFARAAMGTDRVHLYQCQAWAKYTCEADYNQPFHCDFSNHTLTVPAENDHLNSVTILCYFTDVTEAHGPMHYVTRTDSNRVADRRPAPGLRPFLHTEYVDNLVALPHDQGPASRAAADVQVALNKAGLPTHDVSAAWVYTCSGGNSPGTDLPIGYLERSVAAQTWYPRDPI